MRRNLKKYGIIALLLIFLAITVSAKFSLTGIFDPGSLEGKATIMIILTISSVLVGVIDKLFGVEAISLGTFNPQLTGPEADPAIITVVNSFIRLLMPFYILAIILTGLYLLFVSGSPEGRAKAKAIFWRLILSMVIVQFSIPLFQIVLNIAAALTSGIANIMDLDILYVLLPFNLFLGAVIGSISLDPTLLIIAGSWILLFNGLIAVILATRYVLLLILAMLFPFTIFLWYLNFPLTKSFGMSLMRWTFMWAFLSVVMVLVAGASQIAMSSYHDNCSVFSELGITGTTATAIGLKVFQKSIQKVIFEEFEKKGFVKLSEKTKYLKLVKRAKLVGIASALVGIAGTAGFLLLDRDCGMTVFFSFAGTLLMIGTPLMMVGLLKWVGGAMVMYGFYNWNKPHGELFTLAGGILAGMGPAAIIMYGTQMGFRKGGATIQITKPPSEVNKAVIDTTKGRILGFGSDESKRLDELKAKPASTLISKELNELDQLKEKERIFKLKPAELKAEIRNLEGKISPTSDELKKLSQVRRLDRLEDGVRDLGGLKAADYKKLRNFAADVEREEFLGAVGGKIEGGIRRISRSLKKSP